MSQEQIKIKALEEKIAKLEKINKALMDRVERSVDSAGDSFSIFESNIRLQHLVNQRTKELEEKNTALAAAKRSRRKSEQSQK